MLTLKFRKDKVAGDSKNTGNLKSDNKYFYVTRKIEFTK